MMPLEDDGSAECSSMQYCIMVFQILMDSAAVTLSEEGYFRTGHPASFNCARVSISSHCLTTLSRSSASCYNRHKAGQLIQYGDLYRGIHET